MNSQYAKLLACVDALAFLAANVPPMNATRKQFGEWEKMVRDVRLVHGRVMNAVGPYDYAPYKSDWQRAKVAGRWSMSPREWAGQE